MTTAILAVISGLVLLVWSADRFVDGAAGTAKFLGMPTLLIGMVIVGFGTSAPEMIVSAIAASQSNPGIALGNAYGSNIANLGLILGVTAVISPIVVQSQILRRELPLLSLVTILSVVQLIDGEVSRLDAALLIVAFLLTMGWSIREGLRGRGDVLERELLSEESSKTLIPSRAIFWLVVGLLVLMGSSRLLVWGAVDIARALGISDLLIGLTVVAIGTSLPELASSIVACRKNEHDIALGNLLGSNLFNTLAVVGIAGAIEPISVTDVILWRDASVMCILTVSIFVFGYGHKNKPGVIGRAKGSILLALYIVYMSYLFITAYNIAATH
ncbi:MAG: calcium/sodium antiporter [Planctomycetales bacterium]|nr:calcium/sodium antiporter [Planctomycetales bacterium]